MGEPELVTVVRCPRCGSLDAGSVEEVGVEFDRMGCGFCGHSELCDEHQIKDDWNERLPADEARFDQGAVLPDVRFLALWRALGAEGHGRDVFLLLRAAYDEPHRAYHTARHISACLKLLDQPGVRDVATHVDEVEAALWFHDAVYDTRATDNEAKSAELAREHLGAAGVASPKIDRIADHVRATQSHQSDSPDGRLLIDIDLSILAADDAGFARYQDEIRREYAWVDASAYEAGRRAVLQRFADRPALFATPGLRERFESRARANLRRALG
jgi:predicted metal-dependent HD superfamily phosphohydrolase